MNIRELVESSPEELRDWSDGQLTLLSQMIHNVREYRLQEAAISFHIDDEVRWKTHRKMARGIYLPALMDGTIIKCNPKRAKIMTMALGTWNVPYSMLEKIPPAQPQ